MTDRASRPYIPQITAAWAVTTEHGCAMPSAQLRFAPLAFWRERSQRLSPPPDAVVVRLALPCARQIGSDRNDWRTS